MYVTSKRNSKTNCRENAAQTNLPLHKFKSKYHNLWFTFVMSTFLHEMKERKAFQFHLIIIIIKFMCAPFLCIHLLLFVVLMRVNSGWRALFVIICNITCRISCSFFKPSSQHKTCEYSSAWKQQTALLLGKMIAFSHQNNLWQNTLDTIRYNLWCDYVAADTQQLSHFYHQKKGIRFVRAARKCDI